MTELAIQVFEGEGPVAEDPYLFEFEHEMFGPINDIRDGISFNLLYSRCSPHRGGLTLPKTKPLFRRLQAVYLKRGVELTLMMLSKYRIETFHGMSLVHVGEYHYGQYGGSYRSLGFKRGR